LSPNKYFSQGLIPPPRNFAFRRSFRQGITFVLFVRTDTSFLYRYSCLSLVQRRSFSVNKPSPGREMMPGPFFAVTSCVLMVNALPEFSPFPCRPLPIRWVCPTYPPRASVLPVCATSVNDCYRGAASSDCLKTGVLLVAPLIIFTVPPFQNPRTTA